MLESLVYHQSPSLPSLSMLKSKFVFLVSRATRRLKPSLLLSKKRLLSQSLVDAQKMQSEVIPVAPITIAEHDLGFDLSTSSNTPNQTLDENQHRNGSILLGELPSDVILEVFLRLECLDVLSLSQVCSHQCLMHLLFFENKNIRGYSGTYYRFLVYFTKSR